MRLFSSVSRLHSRCKNGAYWSCTCASKRYKFSGARAHTANCGLTKYGTPRTKPLRPAVVRGIESCPAGRKSNGGREETSTFDGDQKSETKTKNKAKTHMS